MTRLERLELSKRRPYARENPGSPTFLLHGQLSDRFLIFGTKRPFYSERFRSIAKIGGATAQSYRNLLRVLVVSSLQFLISPARLFGFCTGSSSALATASNEA